MGKKAAESSGSEMTTWAQANQASGGAVLLIETSEGRYQAYHEDAEVVAKVCGLPLGRMRGFVWVTLEPDDEELSLDLVRSLLVKAGHKVAVLNARAVRV